MSKQARLAREEHAARLRALKSRQAEQALAPVVTPLPPRPFYRGDVVRMVIAIPLLFLIGAWPMAMVGGAVFVDDPIILRDNDFLFGWSVVPAWLASVVAAFALLVPRYLFHTNPPEPIGGIWFLGGTSALILAGVSLFMMPRFIIDSQVQEKLNTLHSHYLYTMPITVRDASWQSYTVTFTTPHARVPELEVRGVELGTPTGTVLCLDVMVGWLGGQWANAPTPCLLGPGQHMATPADLMHPAH